MRIGLRSVLMNPFGQSPICDERFPIRAYEDIRRFEIAMRDTSAMGMRGGVYDDQNRLDQLAKFSASSRVPCLRWAKFCFYGVDAKWIGYFGFGVQSLRVKAVDRLLECTGSLAMD